jgi:hypothetical protein
METTFLIDKDYKIDATDNTLLQVAGSLDLLRKAEKRAKELISGYLNIRYDLAQIFPTISIWEANNPFATDDRCTHQGRFWLSTVDDNEEKPPADWAAGTYADEAVVYHNSITWVSDTAGNTSEPGTDANWIEVLDPEWVEEDPRHYLIVHYMAVCSLYIIYRKRPMKQIPQHVIDDYDEAMKYLERVSKGDLDPTLPKKEDEDGNTIGSVSFGSRLSAKDYSGW